MPVTERLYNLCPDLSLPELKPYHVLPSRAASQPAARMMKTEFPGRKTKDFNLRVSAAEDACEKQKKQKLCFFMTVVWGVEEYKKKKQVWHFFFSLSK